MVLSFPPENVENERPRKNFTLEFEKNGRKGVTELETLKKDNQILLIWLILVCIIAFVSVVSNIIGCVCVVKLCKLLRESRKVASTPDDKQSSVELEEIKQEKN
jgi:hypothetical protein